MKRYLYPIMVFILTPFLINAQNLSDAFRFSNSQISGTARSAGMGNAIGALGGDFTSLSINPAGSGIYRSGEFVFTPVYNLNNSRITLSNASFNDNQSFVNFTNIGIVGSFKVNSNNSGLISVNYGFGYNRAADFQNTSYANKDGSGISYLDDIADWATSEGLYNSYLNKDFKDVEYRDWPAKLAWETFLIDPAKDNNGNEVDTRYVPILVTDEKVDQRKSFSVEGGINEYLMNLSLNFDHVFYVGGTIGIQDISYRRLSVYKEDFQEGGSFTFKDKYSVDGQGFNIKMGAIYKPVNFIRFGLAFHSPTFFKLDELSDLEMESFLAKDYTSYGINEYNYEFHNPLKLIFSGALVLNKTGLISADIEYQNYSNARFRRGGDGSDDYSDVNGEIDKNFKDVLNLRIGGELRFTDKFTGRAGAEFYGNPYKGNYDGDTFLTHAIPVGSLGFGYAINNFSANVTYRQSMIKTSQFNEQPNFYQLSQKDDKGQLMVSFGFRF